MQAYEQGTLWALDEDEGSVRVIDRQGNVLLRLTVDAAEDLAFDLRLMAEAARKVLP